MEKSFFFPAAADRRRFTDSSLAFSGELKKLSVYSYIIGRGKERRREDRMGQERRGEERRGQKRRGEDRRTRTLQTYARNEDLCIKRKRQPLTRFRPILT